MRQLDRVFLYGDEATALNHHPLEAPPSSITPGSWSLTGLARGHGEQGMMGGRWEVGREEDGRKEEKS